MAVTALSGQRWQGSSTATLTPTYTPEYIADDWVIEGSTTYHSIDVGVEIDFKCMRSTSPIRGISYDFGSTLSDTALVCRFQLDLDTIYSNSGGGIYEVFSLNTTDSSVAEAGSNTYFGLAIQHSNTENYFFAVHGVGVSNHSNQTEIGSDMLATGTWYVEMIRLTSTSFSVRVTSSSDYTGGTIVTVTGLSASVDDLQYFTSKTSGGSSIDNYIQGSFKGVKVWNGVTSSTQDDKTTVTDVPVGSEFEQTNDYKSYQYGGYPSGLGSSANGTIGGGVTTGATGEIGNCFSFGGSSSSNVNLGTDSGLNLLDGGTIAFWLKPNGMINKRMCGKGSNSCWEILSEGGVGELDKIKFRLDTGTNGGTLNNCVGTTELDDDGTTWYHICCVYDKDELEMRLYVDGVEETTISITGTIDTVGTALYLGANGSGTANNFTGLLDDFGIWDTILPVGNVNGSEAGTINYLYNDAKGSGTARVCSTIPTGLLAYYNLDGSTCPNGVAGWIERGTAI